MSIITVYAEGDDIDVVITAIENSGVRTLVMDTSAESRLRRERAANRYEGRHDNDQREEGWPNWDLLTPTQRAAYTLAADAAAT